MKEKRKGGMPWKSAHWEVSKVLEATVGFDGSISFVAIRICMEKCRSSEIFASFITTVDARDIFKSS